MKRSLNLQTLAEMPNSVAKPTYPVDKLGIGILHIGLGRFHRGHQAVFNEKYLTQEGGNWGIAAVSLNTRTSVDALNQQDGLYSVQLNDAKRSETLIVGCVRKAHFLGDGLDPILEHFRSPDVHVVTLTITEKGYHYDSNTLKLDSISADLKHDLDNPKNPRTAIGLLALGLEERFKTGGQPINVLSCDNLKGNGSLLKGLITEYLECTKSRATAWVANRVAFPNTMVDRIVPSIDEAAVDQLNRNREFSDAIPIVTEKFGQWIIEDPFTAPRPLWENVGAQIVRDVRVFEEMKLSMLNGTHSYMAYFGSLKGHQFVNEAIADEEIYRSVTKLLQSELCNHIEFPADFDSPTYAHALLDRFKNPSLNHRLLQIAMDGSLKIPQRWIPSLEHALQTDKPFTLLVESIVSWILFCQTAATGRWELNDPLQPAILRAVGNSSDPVAILRSLPQIFPKKILDHNGFQKEFCEKYQKLRSRFLK